MKLKDSVPDDMSYMIHHLWVNRFETQLNASMDGEVSLEINNGLWDKLDRGSAGDLSFSLLFPLRS
jgi:hypothetical protein